MCDEAWMKRVIAAANWKSFPQLNPARIDARQMARIDHANGNYAELEQARLKAIATLQECKNPAFAAAWDRARGIFESAYQAERERLIREANEAKVSQQSPNGHGPFSAHKRKKKTEWMEELDG